MAFEVKMPKLGTTMTEGTIIRWIKKEGERVEKGEPLLEIQTDKVNLEEECPESGILKKIVYLEGQVVEVGKTIAIITKEGEEYNDVGKPEEIMEKKQEVTGEIRGNTEEKKNAESETEKVKASPAAKRLARENNIDIKDVNPTGPDGRIVEKDVINYINKTKVTPVAKKIAEEKGIDLSTITKQEGMRITKEDVLSKINENLTLEENIKRIPLSGPRKIIAEKMKKSKIEAPHFYLTLSVDMTNAIKLKEELSVKIEKLTGVKLSLNDIIIKSAARALKEYPMLNSSIENEFIIVKEDINIGLAVALEEGLVVPVIRNADKKGLSEISKESSELIIKARSGKLLPDDYQGGTFTISNLGMFGIEEFKAVINLPESAILAVGKIVKTPVVDENDELKVKPIMKLTLSCDHRIIDGALGAKFLNRIKELLENPVEMLL
ncbi:dihydrolipoamide acetyltransferase family protein [Thermovenabulum gondwanense]|uniref:Dihydrolipoamide acetyltransferase component of pyruvate dehydrogenase complex n=1 Tax=Thermovenabulum gondwanense TaxID=520767 RepID=A0A162MCG0_9FIRM|nr:dihydrolipoamide acetyltransferase family protein [Thermovenabulum gondwanense]KYO65248.1 Dihydrolipoyllysine-residue acetyltransferase component of pyruvate dehydrogenase complex [Thermovenabulum gondwanense]